jgi:hypothetical protein
MQAMHKMMNDRKAVHVHISNLRNYSITVMMFNIDDLYYGSLNIVGPHLSSIIPIPRAALVYVREH